MNASYGIDDTVAAISTPLGKGGVAVIRISGPEALAVAGRVFRPRSGRPLTDYPPRTAVWGDVVAPPHMPLCPAGGEVLDDGLCTVFRGPHSYTGEDTVELSCHGGVLVTGNVLMACLCAGARQALPGEFTRRAFLNGRLDLEKAEALGNLLDAGNQEQVRLSRAGMNGLLTGQAGELYGVLCGVLAGMEAGMDFPEEDLTELTPEEILTAIRQCLTRIRDTAATYRTGHAIAEGVPAVICGRPNVGKSAFYNRLVGREAAMVTDIAGTTRDVLTETVSLGRVTLRLCDTAGLRDCDGMDTVERMGVERARRAMAEAELIFALFDPTRPYEAEDTALVSLLTGPDFAGKAVVWVATKADLTGGREVAFPDGIPAGALTVRLSSRSGAGFDRLQDAVESAFIDGNLRLGEEAVVFSARQAAALADCAAALERAAEALDSGLTYDICADDIREALAALGTLCGRQAQEDVLTEIFSRFCVGK